MEKIQQLRKKLIKKTKEKVKERYETRDVHIIRAVNTMQDLDSIFNLLFEHVHEWYGVHFPELERLVKRNESYLELLVNLGERKNFSEKDILKHYNNTKAAKKIALKAKESLGSDISKEDLTQMKALAERTLSIKKERDSLTTYIEKEMSSQLKNFSAVAGPILGARLLASAGSIKKLALMPSSTIQVLGAEKALFKHLKTGSKCPKYGLLYQHPFLARVKRGNRGKLARAIAGKLSIAVKEDFFGKKDISKYLLKALEERIKQLQ